MKTSAFVKFIISILFFLLPYLTFSQKESVSPPKPSIKTMDRDANNFTKISMDSSEGNPESISDLPDKGENNPQALQTILQNIIGKFIRISGEYEKIEERKENLLKKTSELQKQIQTTPFPQNIKAKNELERINAELHLLIENSKRLEKEGRDILNYIFNNSQYLDEILKERINELSKRVKVFKMNQGRHIKRLLDEIEQKRLLLKITEKLKEYPDQSFNKPFDVMKDMGKFTQKDEREQAADKIETRLNHLQKEVDFLRGRTDEIQIQIDELRAFLSRQ